MDCEPSELSTDRQNSTGADFFIEETLASFTDFSNFSETQILKLKSDPQIIKRKEEFKQRLLDFESREWDDEEHENCMKDLDLDAMLLIICRTGPFDLNSKEALALMVCAALFSCSNPHIAAKTLRILNRWTKRRHDTLGIEELLAQTMFEELIRWSFDRKLHFRSDYGETIAETLNALQKRSKFFCAEKELLQETIEDILPRLKFRKDEFVLNLLLMIWYLYCDQDESYLEFFKSSYLKYCSRFLRHSDKTYSWDTELRKIQDHDPLGDVDLYQHDPLDKLLKWAGEDDVGVNERFHRSSKPISNADMIEREFNPSIENQCIRELSLMAAFDACDPRTAVVFQAIKSLGIGHLQKQMYLEEWSSRHPSYAGPESVRTLLLQLNPENHSPTEALDILHDYRCNYPVLVFRANAPLLKTLDQETEESKTKSKRAGNESQGETKKKAKKDAKAAEAEASTTAADNVAAQEQAKKANELLILLRFLHRVDVKKSQWSCVLSFAFQLHPERKEEILEFLSYSHKVPVSDLEKRWDEKRGNCLDWGHFLKQYLDAVCSPLDLIKQTLPKIVGSRLLMFGILDQQGCKILRYVPDVVPFTPCDLNLNTGLINCDEKSNLNLIADTAVCSDYMLAEELIKRGFNNRLGFFEDNYYQNNNQSGAWHRIEKDEAQSLTCKELLEIFSRTVALIEFRESIGLHGVPESTTMRKMMKKYCVSHRGVVDVLKAVLPKIRFEPPIEKPHLACFANGLVDLQSKTLLGPAEPSDYVIHSIPHQYDPNADQSLVKRYIQSLFHESVYEDAKDIWEFHQKHLGSFLTKIPRLMPSILFLVGEGSNGKSVYCRLMREALGEYHSTIAAEAFEKAPGTNNDNLHRARFARCSTTVEVEKHVKFHAKTTKNLTGGDETEFSAKFIKGTAETTELKMHIFCNDIPDFTVKVHEDFALGRRLAVVPMRVQFLDDNDSAQKEKLKNAGNEHWIFPKDEVLATQLIENGIPGLLAYMVDGAAKVFADGCKLLLPPTIWTATNQLKCEDADEMLRDFVGAQLTRAAGLSDRTFISTEEITEVYRRLHKTESCLLKSGPFAKTLKILITDAFIKQQVEGRDVMVSDEKKKGVPSPLGPRELRGYYNLVWKKDSDGEVEAGKLKKTYKGSK
jgi:hypothetical protein